MGLGQHANGVNRAAIMALSKKGLQAWRPPGLGTRTRDLCQGMRGVNCFSRCVHLQPNLINGSRVHPFVCCVASPTLARGELVAGEMGEGAVRQPRALSGKGSSGCRGDDTLGRQEREGQ